ncbi:hypothetical protein PMAYCL1PPCAC_10783, partial [Pristionchus mayeri]
YKLQETLYCVKSITEQFANNRLIIKFRRDHSERSIILSDGVLDLSRSQVLVVVAHLVPPILRLLTTLVSGSLSLLQSDVQVGVSIADRIPGFVRVATSSFDDVALDGECLGDVHPRGVLDVELVGCPILRLPQHLRQNARRLNLLQVELHECLVHVHSPHQLAGVPGTTGREVNRLTTVEHLSGLWQSRLRHDVSRRPHHLVVVLPLLGSHALFLQRIRQSLVAVRLLVQSPFRRVVHFGRDHFVSLQDRLVESRATPPFLLPVDCFSRAASGLTRHLLFRVRRGWRPENGARCRESTRCGRGCRWTEHSRQHP